MPDIYGYVLLPVKVRNYQKDEEVGERFRDVQFDHNGVEFWGEDMGFPISFVEALTEMDAINRLAKL